MVFSVSAVRELLTDLKKDRKLKGKSAKLINRAGEISRLKGRKTVGPEDVERAVEQVEDEE